MMTKTLKYPSLYVELIVLAKVLHFLKLEEGFYPAGK